MSLQRYFGPLQQEVRNLRGDVRSLVDIEKTSRRYAERASEELEAAVRETGLDYVFGLEAVADSLRELSEGIDLGFARLAAELDAQTIEIVSLRDVVAHPLRTEARERIERGIVALEHGEVTRIPRWIDEAIVEFDAAISTDTLDFQPYWYLSRIYALHRPDDEKARWALTEAAHYSWPENPRISADALLTRALLEFSQDNVGRAENDAREATRRDPEFPLAHFELGRYLAALRRHDEALSEARMSIGLDPSLFPAVATSTEFRLCPELGDTLHDLDHAARLEQIETVGSFHDLVGRALDTCTRFAASEEWGGVGATQLAVDETIEMIGAAQRKVDELLKQIERAMYPELFDPNAAPATTWRALGDPEFSQAAARLSASGSQPPLKDLVVGAFALRCELAYASGSQYPLKDAFVQWVRDFLDREQRSWASREPPRKYQSQAPSWIGNFFAIVFWLSPLISWLMLANIVWAIDRWWDPYSQLWWTLSVREKATDPLWYVAHWLAFGAIAAVGDRIYERRAKEAWQSTRDAWEPRDQVIRTEIDWWAKAS